MYCKKCGSTSITGDSEWESGMNYELTRCLMCGYRDYSATPDPVRGMPEPSMIQLADRKRRESVRQELNPPRREPFIRPSILFTDLPESVQVGDEVNLKLSSTTLSRYVKLGWVRKKKGKYPSYLTVAGKQEADFGHLGSGMNMSDPPRG